MGSDRHIRCFVNLNFQKALALRMVAHAVLFVWSVSLVCLGLLVVAGELQTDESLDLIRSVCFRAIAFSTVIILPAIAYDSIRFSHRMAGPIMRLNGILPKIGVERIEPLYLRKNDFWQEFIAEVNGMLERVETLRQTAAAPATAGATSLKSAGVCSLGRIGGTTTVCDAGITLCESGATN